MQRVTTFKTLCIPRQWILLAQRAREWNSANQRSVALRIRWLMRVVRAIDYISRIKKKNAVLQLIGSTGVRLTWWGEKKYSCLQLLFNKVLAGYFWDAIMMIPSFEVNTKVLYWWYECCACIPSWRRQFWQSSSRRGPPWSGSRHLKEKHFIMRIPVILVWIRFRFRGSMPLTNGSGSGSGYCYFRHWPSRRQQKTFFKRSFSAYSFLKVPPDPDTAIFVIDLQDANKNLFF